MTDRQDVPNKQQNINQDVRAFDNAHVTAIGNIENVGTLIVNKPDRHILLDDWKPSFEHMQGRKESIAAINIALADPKKAIACIVGLGGYGKSTLAAKLFDEWKGGRFWADLSQRSRDFREFATRAIAQLGQKSLEQVNALPEAQLGYELATVLQGLGFLVVLDNLESLLNGDGNLESVLWREFLENWANDGEGSKVLITTREEPNLPKLRFSRHELSKGLEESEGAAMLRDFGILGTEAELVEVSQRVGGIPLSLMLIVGLLCYDYEEEPHVRFLPKDLFGIEGAHRLGRVTTEAVFRASFERLEPRLQSLLMAVSVFAKPFDRTMAAAMIADEEVTDRDLLLLKKRGFVLVESGCYRFQPQIQELVQRQTADLPELHRRAINFYLTLCEAKPTLDPRHDTLEDADPYLQIFHHCCELCEYESAFYVLRLNGIDSFLSLCGYYAKQVELYTRLVSRWQLEKTQQEYTASLTSLGNAYSSLGQSQQAIAFYQQSLEIEQAISDKKGEANSLSNLGNAYNFLGQYQQAMTFFQQSLEIQQAIGDKKGEANSLGNLGNAYNFLGQYQQAITFLQQSLEIQQAIGDKKGEASSLGNLGSACHSLGQYQQAMTFFQQSLEIKQVIGDKKGEAGSLTNLGSAYNFLGQYQQAITFYQQSLEVQQMIGDKYGEAFSLGNLGNASNFLGQYQQAITFLQQSLEIQQAIGDKPGEANSLSNLGNASNFLGQYQQAITFLQQSLEIQQAIGDKHGEAFSLGNLGNAYRALGHYQPAITFYQQSLEIAQAVGDRNSEATSLSNLANAYHQAGRAKEGFAAAYKANLILQELEPLKARPYPKWLKSIILFAQRGKWQIALCFCIGLFAFPLFLAYLITLLLWRLIKEKVKSRK
jgi:tetratricopeptide (TPR) repeat protein